jgi:hypothetical protein
VKLKRAFCISPFICALAENTTMVTETAKKKTKKTKTMTEKLESVAKMKKKTQSTKTKGKPTKTKAVEIDDNERSVSILEKLRILYFNLGRNKAKVSVFFLIDI